MTDPVEALGATAWEALQRLVRELVARRPGGHLIAAELRELDLHLSLSLNGSETDRIGFARALAAAVDRRLDDLVQHAAAFRPGHAWCHRCGGAACPHSLPPSCRHIFMGYATTGTPRWVDLAQHCLDIKHPWVDRLYADPPAFVTLVHSREALHGAMLRAFDSKTYELLGAVTAGFYRVHSRSEQGRGILAITVQASASRMSDGRRRLGLNLLGRTPSGEDLSSLWEQRSELPWRRAVLWAQAALESVRPRRGANDGGVETRVAGILRGLARRLERDSRARSRRTRHAEERHESGERPTRKAVDDARGARDQQCYIDERSGTVVVLGDRGRTHFFTVDGQHVSSVRYSKDSIARKLKLELWRVATADERAALLEKLSLEVRPDL